MSLEFNALMGIADEEEWESVGLFETVDQLARISSGGGLLNKPSTSRFNASPTSPPRSSKVTTKDIRVEAFSPLVEQHVGGSGYGLLQRNSGFGTETTRVRPGSTSWTKTTARGETHLVNPHDSLRVKDSWRKKASKAWKPKKQRRRLVIGMDVGLEETCHLSLCAVVGRFAYKKRSNITFTDG
jgi:hypothetical protein